MIEEEDDDDTKGKSSQTGVIAVVLRVWRQKIQPRSLLEGEWWMESERSCIYFTRERRSKPQTGCLLSYIRLSCVRLAFVAAVADMTYDVKHSLHLKWESASGTRNNRTKKSNTPHHIVDMVFHKRQSPEAYEYNRQIAPLPGSMGCLLWESVDQKPFEDWRITSDAHERTKPPFSRLLLIQAKDNGFPMMDTTYETHIAESLWWVVEIKGQIIDYRVLFHIKTLQLVPKLLGDVATVRRRLVH